MEPVRTNPYLRYLARVWQIAWPVLRQVLGWFFIFLGILGLVLPVLQGVLFLVIGVALVGRRNWLIRRSVLVIKRALRRWAALPTPVIGPLGRLALRGQHQISRQSRRLHRQLHRRLAARSQPCAISSEPLAHSPASQLDVE